MRRLLVVLVIGMAASACGSVPSIEAQMISDGPMKKVADLYQARYDVAMMQWYAKKGRGLQHSKQELFAETDTTDFSLRSLGSPAQGKSDEFIQSRPKAEDREKDESLEREMTSVWSASARAREFAKKGLSIQKLKKEFNEIGYVDLPFTDPVTRRVTVLDVHKDRQGGNRIMDDAVARCQRIIEEEKANSRRTLDKCIADCQKAIREKKQEVEDIRARYDITLPTLDIELNTAWDAAGPSDWRILNESIHLSIVDVDIRAAIPGSTTDIGDAFVFAMRFHNTGDVTVSALQGVLILKDVFGEALYTFDLEYLDDLPPNGSAKSRQLVRFDQFSDEDQKLLRTNWSKVQAVWVPKRLLTDAGTKHEVDVDHLMASWRRAVVEH